MRETVLEVQRVSKRFKTKLALDGIDLMVREGEVLGLLGPTGAGKTTTLRCIAGLQRPDSGSVRLGGEDVTHLSPMLRDIAVVFEGFNLLPTLSVFDNIAFPLRSPLYREPEAEVRSRAMRAAQDLRIDHLLDRRTHQISGGEKQRVALARALVRRPKLFLLDEPLSALDLKLREALQNELRDMHRRRGQTLVYASHDFLSTAAIASRIAIIDNGRLLQTGTLSEIYADPTHRRVGELIGSPSMSLFEARARDQMLFIEAYPISWPIASLGLPQLTEGANVTIGFWPEDIGLSTTALPEHGPANVWATDFRGKDQAIEARFGPNRVRKVVPPHDRFAQGDACYVRLDPSKAFVFAASGARVRPERVRPAGERVIA